MTVVCFFRIPEWWRAAEAHGRSPAAFFPPFLGLPPLFAPPLQNHEAMPYTSKTLSKSSQGAKGEHRQHVSALGDSSARRLSPCSVTRRLINDLWM